MLKKHQRKITYTNGGEKIVLLGFGGWLLWNIIEWYHIGGEKNHPFS